MAERGRSAARELPLALQLGLSQMHVSGLIIRTCARLRDQAMAEALDRRRAV